MVGEIEEAARALRESEERYQTLADASPVGLLRTNREGAFIYLNERASQITGLWASTYTVTASKSET